jgi:hypothetical protein
MKLLATLAVLAILVLPFGSTQAGDMLNGGAFGMLSLSGNVTINPTFGYYPAVRAEFGLGKFILAGSLGGVFVGETPEQVVGLDGAFQFFNMNLGKTGSMFLYLMGGVTSEQGEYVLIMDGSQYKIGPKVFFDFDARAETPNSVCMYIAMPFMTAKVAEGEDFALESVTYLAVEGGLTFKI